MLEYRSRAHIFDMTWMASHPYLLNFMTHATVFWELSYCALVWPALTRPWVLLMAIFVHGGIALDLTGLEGLGDVDETSLTADVRAGTFGHDNVPTRFA